MDFVGNTEMINTGSKNADPLEDSIRKDERLPLAMKKRICTKVKIVENF